MSNAQFTVVEMVFGKDQFKDTVEITLEWDDNNLEESTLVLPIEIAETLKFGAKYELSLNQVE